MNIRTESAGGTSAAQGVQARLEAGERLHVLRPRLIAAFRGSSGQREDRLLDWKGMYRKKKIIQSDLTGPCTAMLAVPPGYTYYGVRLQEGESLLVPVRHVLFYSSGLEMKSMLQRLPQLLATREWARMRFRGAGVVGMVAQGAVMEMPLVPEEPLHVDLGSLMAYPEDARLELCVYGNALAAQHMNYQWKVTGTGSVLVQTGLADPSLESQMREDGVLRRILREVIPFGSVFIK
ncbi:hypothetical protein J31TS4_12450 [Paenibacillus sp. J31TS4]|uniref:AIM24 family protein n=1 Tax=Paenibacillus sp. J31TS4 TaxID=2807195 RepID=UPI001B1D27DD|nr:AIM24 family protein [Paenibacillus sp. J31TS4]GIP37965.1 hypothetical protein J31TS4_12450 [Paenibacillus sp. J31TS4]